MSAQTCTPQPTALVFIDAALPDLATLRAGLPHELEVHLLDPHHDGLQQMAATLENRQGIAALHLITHGAPGKLFLGNTAIGRSDLPSYRAEINTLTAALVEDGELLIYGCEVAAGREGRQLVGALTEMTGLKVAAATHKVGAQELGGDWQLNVGLPATKPLQVRGWQGVLQPADTTPPQYQSMSASGKVITLIFDETLNPNNVPTADLFTIKVNGQVIALAASNPIAISGSSIILNVESSLSEGAEVSVLYAQPAEPSANTVMFKDLDDNWGNFFALPVTANATAEADTTAPTLDAANSTPADNATDIAVGSDIVIDFSENVAFGSSGTITVRNVTDNSTAGTFTVAEGAITGALGTATISGDKLTINPTSDLAAGKTYAVQFSAGAMVDTAAAPNALAAISDDTTYNFTTAVAVDTLPTLTATGSTPTFTQGSSAGVDLFSTVAANTHDSDQTFTGAKLTVTNVADTTEYLSIGGTDVALTDAASGTIASVGNYSVAVSDGTATITLSGMSKSNADMGTLMDGITYKNSDSTATAGNRVITLTQVTDSGSSNATATLTGVAATVAVATASATAKPVLDLNGDFDGVNREVTYYPVNNNNADFILDRNHFLKSDLDYLKSLTITVSDSSSIKVGDQIIISGSDIPRTYFGISDWAENTGIFRIGESYYRYLVAEKDGVLTITFTPNQASSGPIVDFEKLLYGLRFTTTDATVSTRVFNVSVKDTEDNVSQPSVLTVKVASDIKAPVLDLSGPASEGQAEDLNYTANFKVGGQPTKLLANSAVLTDADSKDLPNIFMMVSGVQSGDALIFGAGDNNQVVIPIGGDQELNKITIQGVDFYVMSSKGNIVIYSIEVVGDSVEMKASPVSAVKALLDNLSFTATEGGEARVFQVMVADPASNLAMAAVTITVEADAPQAFTFSTDTTDESYLPYTETVSGVKLTIEGAYWDSNNDQGGYITGDQESEGDTSYNFSQVIDISTIDWMYGFPSAEITFVDLTPGSTRTKTFTLDGLERETLSLDWTGVASFKITGGKKTNDQIDNIVFKESSVVIPNQKPVIGGIDAYDQGTTFISNADPVWLDYTNRGEGYAFVKDIGSANFAGGYVSVAYTAGTQDGKFLFDSSELVLEDGDEGVFAGASTAVFAEPGFDGSFKAGDKVYHAVGNGTSIEYTEIGTIDATNDGQGGHALKIHLNSAATPGTSNADPGPVGYLLRFLMFSAPSIGERTLSITVNDGDATSTPVEVTVVGIAQPVVDLNGSADGINYTTTFNIGGDAVALAANGTNLSDTDSLQLKSLAVSIDSNTLATGDALVLGTTEIAIDSNTATGIVTYSGTVFAYAIAENLGTMRTITFTSQNGSSVATPADIADFEALLDALSFKTTDVGEDDRVFSISTKDVGDNVTTTPATVTIKAVEAAATPVVLDLDQVGDGNAATINSTGVYDWRKPAFLADNATALGDTAPDYYTSFVITVDTTGWDTNSRPYLGVHSDGRRNNQIDLKNTNADEPTQISAAQYGGSFDNGEATLKATVAGSFGGLVTVTVKGQNGSVHKANLNKFIQSVSFYETDVRFSDTRVFSLKATIDDGDDTETATSTFSVSFAPVKAITYSATSFAEAAANDGSITASITLTLENDTYTGTNGQALEGAVVTHVPAGLTAVVTKTSNTKATVTFTGKATAHANANDIANLTITLSDAAFTGGSAEAVTNATKSDLVIDFANPAPAPDPTPAFRWSTPRAVSAGVAWPAPHT